MCGEKDKAKEMGATTKGSPPRVRGKGTSSASTTALFRITPAYAGKSTHQPPSGRGTRDHPRVCGEKLSTTSTDIHPAGSPPRVRGKDKPDEKKFTFGRITPACAGKSQTLLYLPGLPRDHPRVCGEKLFQSPLLRLPLGSPPRVRGKVSHVQVLQFWAGITPAHAGKSSGRW